MGARAERLQARVTQAVDTVMPQPLFARGVDGQPFLFDMPVRKGTSRRVAAAVALPLALAGCSSNGETPMAPAVTSYIDRTHTVTVTTEPPTSTTTFPSSEALSSASPTSSSEITPSPSVEDEIMTSTIKTFTLANTLATQEPKGRYDEHRVGTAESGYTRHVGIIEIGTVKVNGGKESRYYRITVDKNPANGDTSAENTDNIERATVGLYQGANHTIDDSRTKALETYTLAKDPNGTITLTKTKKGADTMTYSTNPTTTQKEFTPTSLDEMEELLSLAQKNPAYMPR